MTVAITVTREGDTNTIRVTPEAADVRRRVGPAAWFVFEHLALISTPDHDGGWIAATNVRAIAVACGIGKDRAGAALRVLRDARLVTTARSSPAPGARFEPSRYRIQLPADPAEAPTKSATVEPRSPRRSREHISNPTLFGTNQ